MALSITNLTSGSDATNNPATTASISPTSGGVVLASVAFATLASGMSAPTVGIVGCDLTWELIDQQVYGRRAVLIYKGTGTPSSGTLSLEAEPNYAQEWVETAWCIDQVTGQDGTTPFGASAKNSTAGATSLSVTVSGTPDAGDFIYAAFGLEDGTSLAINGELSNQLAAVTGLSNIRNLLSAYDSSPDASPTPGITWTTTNSAGGIAFIVNVGGASQSNAPRAAYQYSLRRR